ncbi:orotidine-5'-phosphate decarboxylase [Clostridium manihotivorum]|uniref:Orotidine 5'-phosphate decarboxylase n=1 Tax=Clostridium manihotivorum TaxID=2320868 RepID=A0A3R5VAH0_9CLOT|nr:orotidine-5'-phosphate decarboxylase [Clostridium manihotivorum]QAA33887.1 orotidine-5'-phosphate decarboxylase [Clostridium manihotivorum]
MSNQIVDRLYEKVEKNGVVCVGLDTDISYIPESIINEFTNIEDAIFQYNRRIIDATYDVVACFKLQIAYYEALGISGLIAYKKTLEYLRERKLITIADIKRGDIAATAKMYAKAHFTGEFESDFITLNPYMGMDSIEPYLPYLESKSKGIFALVKTSNKGSGDIQDCNIDGKGTVYDHVGNMIESLGRDFLGNSGYSSLGVVVGCTHIEQAKRLRENLKSSYFLIPGYGAQGGKAEDVAVSLRVGNGGVVNSSRKILLAYKEEENYLHFEDSSRKEAIRMREDIRRAVLELEAKNEG